ncbi:AAA family ATPase, partial [Bdellovibrionota bacterium FG-2]
MFKRIFQMPKKSFLLLGPRGTGKSTWLRTQKFDLVIDLLKSRTRLELERNPSHLHALVAPIASGGWVLIDEVQKIPALLDEVHSIYEERGINFALTGSSARKLKRSGVNLLAGRALNFSFFPLVYPEYGDAIPLMDRVEWGTLPLVVDQMEHRADTLETYVDNYLRQELVEEGIVRNLEPFTRFLQISAMMNAQILNVENIARDAQVKRPTVDKYFEVLIDTLIGYRLPAYQPGLKTKEVAHPKFYFFDPGVARAAAGLVREPLDRSQLGFQLETFLLNEVRAY